MPFIYQSGREHTVVVVIMAVNLSRALNETLYLKATECHLPYGITVLPATRHKRTHPALSPARQVGTRFTYPRGMEG